MFFRLGKKRSNKSNRAGKEELFDTKNSKSVCEPNTTAPSKPASSESTSSSAILETQVLAEKKNYPVHATSGTRALASKEQQPLQQPNDDTNEGLENQNRSVNDFRTKDELRSALVSGIEGSCCASEAAWLFSKDQDILHDLLASPTTTERGSTSNDECEEGETDMTQVHQRLDWILENYDEATTKRQSISHELRRLLVLKSYLILDTERKESFDQVTNLARERFECPMAVISLVDLGRQWFLSTQGVGEIRETPRKISFCAHAIMSTEDCLVVPDATKDFRFQNNPFVTGKNIRFYAGAPLISPEGYKLGTLCVLDTKPRAPWTPKDKFDLTGLAATAIRILLDHRRKMSLWFNNLVSTHYPDFEVDDENQTDMADVESLSCLEKDRRPSKDDRAVSSFLETTKQMPLTDILSMLENQAKAQNMSLGHLKEYTAIANLEGTRAAKSKRQKKLRFAEDEATGEVRTQIHQVDCWKDMKDIWWNPQEMFSIRAENHRIARYFRRRRRDYIQNIQFISLHEEPQKLLDGIVKELVEDSYARGLEGHIVKLLSSTRKLEVRAVLDEQLECQADNDDFDSTCYFLREQSLLHSKISSRLAEKMGQCDQIIALKSSLSPWEEAAASQSDETTTQPVNVDR